MVILPSSWKRWNWRKPRTQSLGKTVESEAGVAVAFQSWRV